MKENVNIDLEKLIWNLKSPTIEQLREISLHVLGRLESQFCTTVKFRENLVDLEAGALFAVRLDSVNSMIPMHWEGLLIVQPCERKRVIDIYIEALAFILGNRCSPSDPRHGSFVTSWYQKREGLGEWDTPSWSVDGNGEWESYRFEDSLF